MDVDVLVITALKMEFDAFHQMASHNGKRGVRDWTVHDEQTSSPYEVGTYQCADGRIITIALARPTRIGTTSTLPITSALLERLKPRSLAMSGVCAGNPGSLSLGDVIISEIAYPYDEGKRTTQGFEGDHRQIPIRNSWLRAAQELRSEELSSYGEASKDEALLWLLDLLDKGINPALHPARRNFIPDKDWGSWLPEWEVSNFIRPKGETYQLAPKGRRHIQAYRRTNKAAPSVLPFSIHVGPIASGNVVVKDGVTWDMLRKFGVRTCLGLEMEAAAIARAAFDAELDDWIVIKGVMDYADPGKDDRYKPFAAKVSAEVLLRFLEGRVARRPETLKSTVGRALVIGGVTRESGSRTLEADYLAHLSVELGRSLADRGVELVVCSPFPGSADVSSVLGYADGAAPVRITFHHPDHPDVDRAMEELRVLLGDRVRLLGKPFRHQRPLFSESDDVGTKRRAWGEAWRISQLMAVRNADVVVALGGRTDGSAITTLTIAEVNRVPVLPLSVLGGAAAHIHENRDWKAFPNVDKLLLTTRHATRRLVSEMEILLRDAVGGPGRMNKLPGAVFLSRAREDQALVEPLLNLLYDKGIEVRMGDVGATQGEAVEKIIEQAIRASEAFIAVWTQKYALSQWCHSELDQAVREYDHGKHRLWLINTLDTPVAHRAGRQVSALRAGTPESIRNSIAAILDAIEESDSGGGGN